MAYFTNHFQKPQRDMISSSSQKRLGSSDICDPHFNSSKKMQRCNNRFGSEVSQSLVNPEEAADIENKSIASITIRLALEGIAIADQPTRKVFIFTDPQIQDPIKWCETIRSIAKTNRWAELTSFSMLDVFIDKPLLENIKEMKTFDARLDKLCGEVFTPDKYNMYKTLLKTSKRENFASIKRFIEALEDYKIRADLCNVDRTDKFSEREIVETIVQNITSREKELLMLKGTTKLSEIKETLVQMDTLRDFYHDKSTQNMAHMSSKNSNSHYPIKEKKYCTFHKSNFHNTSECRARNNRTNGKKNKENTLLTTTSSHTALEIDVVINNKDVQLIIDSGAEKSFLSRKLVKKLGIRGQTTQANFDIILGNGTTHCVKEQISLQTIFPSLGRTYIVEYGVLDNLPCDGLLGLAFLKDNHCSIDFATGKIQVKDLNSAFNPDCDLTNKSSSIYSFNSLLNDITKFQQCNPKLGLIRDFKMRIPLKDNTPVHKKPYPVPLSYGNKVKEEIAKLLEMKIIRESNSSYASPAFPRMKKNGDIRLIIDYRELNSKTVKREYPFPSIQHSLVDLKGANFFSQLDLNMGHYQIEIDENGIHKTAFVLPFGQYEFLRMPFGLTNAPREFQKTMNAKLQDLPFVKVFVDDILIFSKTPEEHHQHVIHVLSRINEEGISVNYSKSSFGKSEVSYLGKIINKEGIRPDTSTLVHHENKINPSNKKELMKVLGLINWFRDHIPNLSTILLPITDKLCGNKPFSWSHEDETVLRKVLSIIKKRILLNHPDISKPFTLATDACDRGLGATLLQENKIVGIYSCRLHDAEINYTTTEKELLAIIKALNHCRAVILGAKIQVKTDHKNLLFILKCESNRAQRWKILLDKYGVELIHVEGKENNQADLLSRCFTSKNLVNCELERLLKLTELEEEQKKELNIRSLSSYHLKQFPGSDIEIHVTSKGKIFIPKTMCKSVIGSIHNFLAHPGINRCAQTIARSFYIKELYKVVARFTYVW